MRFWTKFMILSLLVLGPRIAAAHAILMESTPAVNATIAGPSIAFALHYNSRVDHDRSRLTLTLPDSTTQVLPIAPTSPEDGLLTSADLKPGRYSLRWQVLAVDGHITRGDVPFTVDGN
jgi:hypothetical protein